jgi:hypothetical protein
VEARGTYVRRRLAVVGGAALFLIVCVVIAAALLDIGPFEDDLTKEEFIAQGDAICKAAQEDFAAAQREVHVTTAPQAQALMQRLLDVSTGELESIRDLNEPDDVQPAFDRYLAAREEGIALLHDGLDAAQENNGRAYEQAQLQVALDQQKRLELAEDVGFSQCSHQFLQPPPGGAEIPTG